MNWNLFVTELVAGITHGSVYALIALGYSMVYGILKLLNFAHGDVFMVGAFIGYGVLTAFGGAAALSIPIALLLALMFIAAMLGGGLLGVVIERFAYRRLREAPRIAPLITALGVSFFLENAALLLLGADYQSYNTFSWNGGVLWSNGFTLPAGVHVALAQIIVVVGALVLMVRAHATSSRARSSAARCGPTSFDRQAAEMMGIDVNRVIAVDVLHRLGARGRGGHLQLPRLPAGLAVHGLRRRASRRSPPRSSAASAACRAPSSAGSSIGLDRGVRDRLPLVHVPGRDRLRDPDRRDDPAPERPLRTGRGATRSDG